MLIFIFSFRPILNNYIGSARQINDINKRRMPIMGKPIVAGPPSACTETYIVVGVYDNEDEAENLESYLRTRFLRFLVGLRKNTQDITQDRFAFVPQLPMTKEWSDKKLYSHFGITEDEVAFIETIVRPMEVKDE